jgi:hypothetical protein
LARDRLQRVEPWREGVAGLVDRLLQILREGGGFVVGQVKVYRALGGDPNGRLEAALDDGGEPGVSAGLSFEDRL